MAMLSLAEAKNSIKPEKNTIGFSLKLLYDNYSKL